MMRVQRTTWLTLGLCASEKVGWEGKDQDPGDALLFRSSAGTWFLSKPAPFTPSTLSILALQAGDLGTYCWLCLWRSSPIGFPAALAWGSLSCMVVPKYHVVDMYYIMQLGKNTSYHWLLRRWLNPGNTPAHALSLSLSISLRLLSSSRVRWICCDLSCRGYRCEPWNWGPPWPPFAVHWVNQAIRAHMFYWGYGYVWK